ncbi:hypothetical protein [Haloprofundus sp. MHR1]|uniref:hypothetical protein n=1 Tax=Haloprofundus sp. MHR1 TaxID=2572921 RepID=UPI0010BEC9BE|nr:hypothetical protein [Haloprofundus sp. MHR1]QCJ46098.1 hypothetical protein FCF25_02725 [Haloprofundus sp. MHR1]
MNAEADGGTDVDEKTKTGADEETETDETDESAARRGQTRTVVAVALLFSLLGATLPRLASGDPLAAWEILLLSTLGLAAGVATLGGESIRTAAAVFRESGP